MNLENKKILVTGADGFIGSHLTETLVSMGLDVRAFVYYNSFNSWGWLDHSNRDIRKNIDIFTGDIRDPYGVKEAVEGCNIIFHLAALIAIPYSYHSPQTYIETNIQGTLNIVQAARQCGVEKVVHTSTSEVYGSAQYVPIDEKHPITGQSPYSATKIGADQIAISFHRSFDTPISIIRPFNTYGPRQSARAVIPTIILQILSGSRTLKLGTTKTTRDFNYIEDTVSGFISVARSEKSVGQIINIGSNFEISIEDTAYLIANNLNEKIDIVTDDNRLRPTKSEVDRLCADNSKAKMLTDWIPKYSGIEGLKLGLNKTIDWFKNPENKKMYKSEIYNI